MTMPYAVTGSPKPPGTLGHYLGPQTLLVQPSTDPLLYLASKHYDAPCTARHGKQKTTSIVLPSTSLHSRVERTSNLTLIVQQGNRIPQDQEKISFLGLCNATKPQSPKELSAMMNMFYICAVQCGSHKPRVAMKH